MKVTAASGGEMDAVDVGGNHPPHLGALRPIALSSWILRFYLLQILGLLFTKHVEGVAIVHVGMVSGRNSVNDYVLHGEGATLQCYYALEPGENIKVVRWTKGDDTVYEWHHSRPPEARGLFRGRVNHRNGNSTSSAIVELTDVHYDMHGVYTCHVESDKKQVQSADIQLTVIAGACQESDFRTHTDMVACTERIEFQCPGMFPKPSPSCGVYNELTGVYLESVPFDHTEQLTNNSYKVVLSRTYDVRDWLNYTDITFTCFVTVMGTTWQSGIKHHLFGDQGCLTNPPAVENGDFEWIGTPEKTCWGSPREGSRIHYRCYTNFFLIGSSTMVCKGKEWIPEYAGELPYCSPKSGATANIDHSLSLILVRFIPLTTSAILMVTSWYLMVLL